MMLAARQAHKWACTNGGHDGFDISFCQKLLEIVVLGLFANVCCTRACLQIYAAQIWVNSSRPA